MGRSPHRKGYIRSIGFCSSRSEPRSSAGISDGVKAAFLLAPLRPQVRVAALVVLQTPLILQYAFRMGSLIDLLSLGRDTTEAVLFSDSSGQATQTTTFHEAALFPKVRQGMTIGLILALILRPPH
jgi:hypothetical protein